MKILVVYSPTALFYNLVQTSGNRFIQLLKIALGQFPPNGPDSNQKFVSRAILLPVWINRSNKVTPYIFDNVKVRELRWPRENLNIVLLKPHFCNF